jgi:hypothetical protein
VRTRLLPGKDRAANPTQSQRPDFGAIPPITPDLRGFAPNRGVIPGTSYAARRSLSTPAQRRAARRWSGHRAAPQPPARRAEPRTRGSSPASLWRAFRFEVGVTAAC